MGSSFGIKEAVKFSALSRSFFFSLFVFYLFPGILICLLYPSKLLVNHLSVCLYIVLQRTKCLESPLQPWPFWRGCGCFTRFLWIGTLWDKEEAASRSFHVSHSCLSIRATIWFCSWKVPLCSAGTVK